jgi:predicted phage terminase large subunit-like protein
MSPTIREARRASSALLLLTVAALAAGTGTALSPRAAALAAPTAALELATGTALELVALHRDVLGALRLLLGSPQRTNLRDAKARAEASLLDFVELFWGVIDPGTPFSRGKVQEAIALHLEAIHHDRIQNFLGNVPPGSTKTYLTCVFFPAWEWGPRNRPDLRYMTWSYSAQLTEEANEKCRKVIRSELYQRFWGDRFQLDESSDSKTYYANNKGGWRRSSSIGGASTGFRADRLIWDDPHNVRDAYGSDASAKLLEAQRWFAMALPTRVRNAGGGLAEISVPFWVRAAHGTGLDPDPDDQRPVVRSATIGIMQRVHPHDLSAIVLRNPALDYEVLLIEMRYQGDAHPVRRLPTWRPSRIGYQDWRTTPGELADPVRYDAESLARLEAQMLELGGSDAILAQLEQSPKVGTGSKFLLEWLPVIQPHEVPADVPLGHRGWDWASGEGATADRTADARVARSPTTRKFFLWDTHAMRGGPGAVDAFVRRRHAEDPPSLHWSIPRDPGATGRLFASYVVGELAVGRYVTSSAETQSKQARADPLAAQAEHGNFVIVAHPGWELARAELVDFPFGKHDDLVDAITRAFAACIADRVDDPGTLGAIVVGPDINADAAARSDLDEPRLPGLG